MLKTSSWIRDAKVYTPGLSIEEIKNKYSLKTVYKLASNENPLPPPKGLLEFLKKDLSSINRYPAYLCPALKAASEYYKVDTSQLALGNGSSELIDKLIQAYGESGTGVLISKNSFPLYDLLAHTHRLPTYKVPMKAGFKVDIEAILSTFKKHKNIGLIFISNPNNPTGSYLSQGEIEHLLSSTENDKVLVVLDEAYLEYVRAEDFPNSLELLKKYQHLVVLRSMSKVMGLAGLRLGLMLAQQDIVVSVRKVLCPFNINSMAIKAMEYCFSNPEFKKYLLNSKKLVWESLDFFYRELQKIHIKFYPSQGNFLLFAMPKKAFSFFLERGLILRSFKEEPELENFLRMSVGLEKENNKAIELIKEFCGH